MTAAPPMSTTAIPHSSTSQRRDTKAIPADDPFASAASAKPIRLPPP